MRIKITLYRLILIIACLVVIALGLMWTLSLPALAPNAGLQQNNNQPAENADRNRIFPADSSSGIDDAAVSAKSYLVYDMRTNTVLASRLPNMPVSIASLTKLMTGYVVNKYGVPSDVVTIKPEFVLNISPVLRLQAGDQVKVSDLFQAMMVGSANDAALTLGFYLGGKMNQPIAEVMNSEAKELGMNDTHFSTPVGFDSDTNYSTASDLALLVRKTTTDPAFTNINRLLSYSFTSERGTAYSVSATNKLLGRDSELRAVKTGYTDDAGGAMIVSVQNLQAEFVIILLNSENREQDTLLLKAATLQKYFQP